MTLWLYRDSPGFALFIDVTIYHCRTNPYCGAMSKPLWRTPGLYRGAPYGHQPFQSCTPEGVDTLNRTCVVMNVR